MDKLKVIESFKHIISYLPKHVKDVLANIPEEIIYNIQEIRLRSNRPIILNCYRSCYFITVSGMVTTCIDANFLVSSQNEIFETFKNMCDYSIYSYQSQIKNGFITIKGGHRVGICGTAVIDNNEIISVKDISSLNIRIARQICFKNHDLISALGNGNEGILLSGPPSCGKTTILRDIAKSLSDGSLGFFKKVVVVDERGELSATFLGDCQNDLGFCDVLNLYPKGEGIIHAIRALSPEVIICDELGGDKDIIAIEEGLNAGVSIIASIHAGSIDELIRRNSSRQLIATKAFKKIVMMRDRNNPGCIEKIYEEEEINDKISRLNNADNGRNGCRIYGIA